jgi:hypothetical protein
MSDYDYPGPTLTAKMCGHEIKDSRDLLIEDSRNRIKELEIKVQDLENQINNIYRFLLRKQD